MEQYDKSHFATFREATTAANAAKTAYTLALEVPVAEDAGNVLREQRISLYRLPRMYSQVAVESRWRELWLLAS